MEDNFLNTEELERMLGPQCEFHASEGLKDKVMNEARAVSRPRRLRLIPWLAAACVAGILVIFLTPPKDSGTATSENVTAATTENVAATTSGSVAATTSKSSTVADIGQNGQQGSVKPKTAENPQKEKYIAAAPAKRKRTADGHAPKENGSNQGQPRQRTVGNADFGDRPTDNVSRKREVHSRGNRTAETAGKAGVS